MRKCGPGWISKTKRRNANKKGSSQGRPTSCLDGGGGKGAFHPKQSLNTERDSGVERSQETSAASIKVEHSSETLLTIKIEPVPKDRPYAYSKFSRRTVQHAPDMIRLASEIKAIMNFVGYIGHWLTPGQYATGRGRKKFANCRCSGSRKLEVFK